MAIDITIAMFSVYYAWGIFTTLLDCDIASISYNNFINEYTVLISSRTLLSTYMAVYL